MTACRIVCMSLVLLAMGTVSQAQESENPTPVAAPAESPQTPANSAPIPAPSTTEQLKDSTDKLADQTKKEVEKIADVVDHDQRAKTVAAGILQPIYLLAEKLAFPAFHWMAFCLMSAGVVGYGLQVFLGKLVVLTRMGFSLKEIISDVVGLKISIIGLVLTTQAAAENSSFTQSPAAVLSSAAVGLIAGFILYRWGQSQELQAVVGRTVEAKVARKN